MNDIPDLNERLLPYRFMSPDMVEPAEGGSRLLYRDVEYALLPGFRPLVLDLSVPRTRAAPVPAVIYCHPGAWLTGTHKPNAQYACQNAILMGLAQAGFAFAAVQYRLSSEAKFPACLHDVAAAVRWVRHFAPALGVDGARIGVWGESCGGHLASFLAMNVEDEELTGSVGVRGASSAVQAGVSWYGVTDFLTLSKQALPGTRGDFTSPYAPGALLIGAGLQQSPEFARRASPRIHASSRAAPMFFVHGERDLTTPPDQSRTLHRALLDAGVEAHLTTVPGADHQLIGTDPAPFVAASTAFLVRHLMAGVAMPDAP